MNLDNLSYNYYKRIRFVKKQLFFNKTFAKEDLFLFATKLTEKKQLTLVMLNNIKFLFPDKKN